jgi:hypothetical protein
MEASEYFCPLSVSSFLGFSGIHVARSLVFSIMLCRSLFVFFLLTIILSVLRFPPLVSSNFLYYNFFFKKRYYLHYWDKHLHFDRNQVDSYKSLSELDNLSDSSQDIHSDILIPNIQYYMLKYKTDNENITHLQILSHEI